MRILYDHQIFTNQNYGGISRYYHEIMKYLQKKSLAETILPPLYTNNYYLKSDTNYSKSVLPVASRDQHKKTLVEKLLHKPKLKLQYEQRNFQSSIQALEDGEYNLFHPTYYDPYFIHHLHGKPFVLTVYDMIHELFPESFLLADPVRHNKRKLVKAASKIIAISQNTKKDMIELYNIPESQIEVIYLGSSLSPADNTEDAFISVPARYLLFVGIRVTYKNFYFFVNAITRQLMEEKDLFLICAGGGDFSFDEQRFIRDIGLQDKVLYREATNQNLIYLYQNALAFVFPSLYEGFGIPVLEAFNCGCPVIVSRNSSLTEVGGDAVYYIDPKSVVSIRDAIVKITHDDHLRSKLCTKGFQQSARFSWSKCASETLKVYNAVLQTAQQKQYNN